jgi:hypothetical protein
MTLKASKHAGAQHDSHVSPPCDRRPADARTASRSVSSDQDATIWSHSQGTLIVNLTPPPGASAIGGCFFPSLGLLGCVRSCG